MAEVFTNAATGTRSLPEDAFFELKFDPAPGGGHVSASVTGGPTEVIFGDGPRDPIGMVQHASVRADIIPPGSTTPLVSKSWSIFDPHGDPSVITGFVIPSGARPGWTCRLTNVGPSEVRCEAKVLYTAFQRQIVSTPIARRLINNALHQLLDAVGLQIRLDGANSVIAVSPELRELLGDKAPPDQKISLGTAIRNVNLQTLRVEALREGLGVDTPRVRIFVEFETVGPAEISRLGGLAEADITEASIQVDFSLTTEGPLGRRRIVPSNFKVTANIDVHVTSGTRNRMIALGALLAGGLGALAGILAVDKVEDAINDLLGELPNLIESFLNRSQWRSEVGRFLTQGFLQLANRDHVFHDLKHVGNDWVVEHWDPTAEVVEPPPTPPTGGGGSGGSGGSGGGGGRGGGGGGGPQPPGGPDDPRIPPGGHIPLVGRRPEGARASFRPRPRPAEDPAVLANLRRIDRIVVLMQENRSFDQLLGYLRVGNSRSRVDGLRGRESNRAPGNISVRVRPTKTTTCPSPEHEFSEVAGQIADGAMSGFLTSWIHRYPDAPLSGNAVTPLSYYRNDTLKVTRFLVDNYTICNRWFSSFPGGTQPNRFCTLGGSTPVLTNFPVPHRDIGYLPYPTIFERLDDARVAWAYYEHDVAFLRFYNRYRLDNRRVLPIGKPGDTSGDGFYARARNGTLPPVTFIDPNFVDIPPLRTANDDHPPADLLHGQELIASIHDALVRQPRDQFASTLFIVTYDEHGGFYDHVPPPGASLLPAPDQPNAPADRSARATGPTPSPPIVPRPQPPSRPAITRVHPEARTYGVRVPTAVISPRVRAGDVTNVVFDHTSIAKTILLRFVGPNYRPLGERMEQAHHLGEILLPTARPERPIARPLPPPPPPGDDDEDRPPGTHPRIAPPPRLPAAAAPATAPSARAARRASTGDEFHEAIRHFGLPFL